MNQQPSDRKIIFILGAPRSGTTLLMGMLVQNQKLIGGLPQESQFYTNACRKEFELKTYLQDKYFSKLLNEKEIGMVFDKSNNHLDFFNNAINFYLDIYNKEIFVEKSPTHTLFIKQIERDFPNSYFILIKRNAHANIQSIFATKWWIPWVTYKIQPKKVREFMGYLVSVFIYYRYCLAFKKVEESERCILSIRYEELLDGNIKKELESELGIRMDKLYIFPPWSNAVSHRMNILDKSRKDGYKMEMPIYMQKLIQKIFEPSGNMDKILSLLVKCCLYPLIFMNKVKNGYSF